MLAIVAIGCFAHGFDRFITGEPSLRKNLVHHAITSVKAVPDVNALLIASHDSNFIDKYHDHIDANGTIFMSSFSKPESVAKDVTALIPESHRGQDCLILAPTAGPVAASRITALVDYAKGTGKNLSLVGSAYPIDANCNPIWLKYLGNELGNKAGEKGVTGMRAPKQSKFLDMEGKPVLFPSPKGSQWLPELYQYEGALTFVRGGEFVGAWHYQLSSREEGLPILYRLPVFQLHQSYDWKIPFLKNKMEHQ